MIRLRYSVQYTPARLLVGAVLLVVGLVLTWPWTLGDVALITAAAAIIPAKIRRRGGD